MSLDINLKTPDSPEAWLKLGEEFENASAKETLKHALTQLIKSGDVLFLTAFGPEGCIIYGLIDELLKEGSIDKSKMIRSQEELDFYDGEASREGKFVVANLDTGYQFKETLELKEKLESKYDMPTLLIQPKYSVVEQDEKYGKDLFSSDPDQCCYMRKLVPLSNLLQPRLAWITSIRRDQTEYRAKAKAFEFDKKFKLGKINPLIHWSKSDVWKYIHENNVPYNPLLDNGYDSIGCEPCTSPGTDRKGRWAGKDKIECGLHIQDDEQKQGGEFVI